MRVRIILHGACFVKPVQEKERIPGTPTLFRVIGIQAGCPVDGEHGGWSPTGKPVVPNNHARLRRLALKRFTTQAPRLRRVIRPAAKSAEAR
jgi:hypothetical protein